MSVMALAAVIERMNECLYLQCEFCQQFGHEYTNCPIWYKWKHSGISHLVHYASWYYVESQTYHEKVIREKEQAAQNKLEDDRVRADRQNKLGREKAYRQAHQHAERMELAKSEVSRKRNQSNASMRGGEDVGNFV